MKWIGLGFLLSLSALNGALASNLKTVKFRDGNIAELTFDSKVEQGQVQMDFFGDTVQLSLSNSSIYPAKMIPITDDLVTKIFAYQYSPKLVRCRFSVKGKAEDLKNHIRTVATGKVIRVEFPSTAQAQNQPQPQPQVQSQSKPLVQSQDAELDEDVLMDKVLKMSQASPETTTQTSASAPASETKNHDSGKLTTSSEKTSLTGGKPLPSIWSAFAKLGALLVGLGIIALVLKRGKRGSSQASEEFLSDKSSSWMGKLKQIARGTLNKDRRMLQIVSTQYIGPKKSLVVVRFSGRLLVLGVGHDTINLITQISEKTGEDVLEDHTGSISSQSDIFSEILKTEDLKSSALPPQALSDTQEPSLGNGARSRIRSRLEGLKPL